MKLWGAWLWRSCWSTEFPTICPWHRKAFFKHLSTVLHEHWGHIFRNHFNLSTMRNESDGQRGTEPVGALWWVKALCQRGLARSGAYSDTLRRSKSRCDVMRMPKPCGDVTGFKNPLLWCHQSLGNQAVMSSGSNFCCSNLGSSKVMTVVMTQLNPYWFCCDSACRDQHGTTGSEQFKKRVGD